MSGKHSVLHDIGIGITKIVCENISQLTGSAFFFRVMQALGYLFVILVAQVNKHEELILICLEQKLKVLTFDSCNSQLALLSTSLAASLKPGDLTVPSCLQASGFDKMH